MSLRDKLLSLLTNQGEEKPSLVKAPAPAVVVREESAAERKRDAEKEETSAQDKAPASSDGCPRCGDALFVEVAAHIRRCQQCGHQQRFERKRTVVPGPGFIKNPRSTPLTACPACASSLLQGPLAGVGLRCGQCGWQSGDGVPSNGLSRKDLENYDGKPRPTPK